MPSCRGAGLWVLAVWSSAVSAAAGRWLCLSEVGGEQDDSQILCQFVEHKMASQILEVADKWRTVHGISWMPQTRALLILKKWKVIRVLCIDAQLLQTAGISDGFARRFGRDLRAFKQVHREQEEAANALVVGGGFNSITK
jgi:hypothetical protein